MNVVGRVGSLISQGVYSVAMPFHPFGGAVDIIVVEQQDGTYRSTPWYVRFGKFQGIIKGAEKVVTIAVNGVEADFHMYLDHSGQAYFLREVESNDDTQSCGLASVGSSPRKSVQDDANGNNVEVHESVCEGHGDAEENDENACRYQDEHEHASPAHSTSSRGFGTYNYGNMEDMDEMVKTSNDANSEMVLVSVDGHVLTAPISADEEESTDYVQKTNPQFHLGPGDGSTEEFGAIFGELDVPALRDTDASDHQFEVTEDADGEFAGNNDTDEDNHCNVGSGEDVSAGPSVSHEEVQGVSQGEMGANAKDIRSFSNSDDMYKSCLDLASHIHGDDSQDASSDLEDIPKYSLKVSCSNETVLEENAVMDNSNCKPDSSVSADIKQEDVVTASEDVGVNSDTPFFGDVTSASIVIDSSEKVSVVENVTEMTPADSISNTIELPTNVSGRSDIEGENHPVGTEMSTFALGFELSLCANLLRPGMGHGPAEEAFEAHRVSIEEFKACGPSIIKNGNLIVRYKESYFPWHKIAYTVLGTATFGSNFSGVPQDSIPIEDLVTPKDKEDVYANSPSSRRWRLWHIPFRRAASLQHTNSNSSSEEFFVDSESALQSPYAEQKSAVSISQSPRKQLLRTFIPTTEQIASLKLKDGQNNIAFSYSTRVLGKQEVDAHVYLWKWNARIVISDVDGTITKSDVLGQFMPLVGKDWTQSGVAGLFSAIKENGYQLLFLSARAIVQAYLTRSFLLNLKQDGKALPTGPVVISPDGLFPSLFREVIRRAPHEFKIACLEDIKALFPSDYNPFYAGFGNRDTDELSYRKIGIPKGKIFIINPKGEVAINHCIDVKSYTSLHTLVNDMFPSTSLVEQEDFNSWNYWKMPLPDIN